MRYAMTVKNKVIDVVESSTAPVWPATLNGDCVIAIPCVDNVAIGMDYNSETDTFGFLETTTFEQLSDPLTESEERQIDILLNTEYIACLLENQLI